MEEFEELDFMLNKFLLNIMKITSEVTGTLGFCPIVVDTIHGKFTVNTWRWARTVHNFLWLLCYATIVLPTHLYEVYTSGNAFHTFSSNSSVIYLLLATILCYIAVLFLGICAVVPQGLCQLLNGLYKFMETFTKNYTNTYDWKKERRKMRQLEFWIAASSISIAFPTILLVLHCYTQPTASAYPAYRVWTSSQFIKIPLCFLSSTWFAISGMCFVAVGNIFMVNAIFYFLYVFPIIRDELRRGRKRYKTLDILREPYQLVVNYRAFQILTGIVNTEICTILIPIQALIIAAILVSNVSLAFQWELFTITTKIFLTAMSVVLLVGWSIILWMAGQQFGESKKTVGSWKLGNFENAFDEKYMKRVKLACQPICIGDGKRFLLKPTKVLLFVNSVNRNTFKAFAMYRKTFGS
ncbi:unnamed protein product [Orchesella dallaii]|uniref:Odorant receptor n=1 Tax=Orchesella dallaii TaxID=48710 RepID=A0ABP1Q0X8_9HEXA